MAAWPGLRGRQVLCSEGMRGGCPECGGGGAGPLRADGAGGEPGGWREGWEVGAGGEALWQACTGVFGAERQVTLGQLHWYYPITDCGVACKRPGAAPVQ